MKAYRWVVLALILVVYVVVTADRANIGIVLPFIREEFGLSSTDVGGIASLFFVGYALGQLPAGFLIKRAGTRVVMSVFLVLTSVFTGLIGAAGSAFHLKALRLGLGFAEAPIPVAILTTINNWFPAREVGRAGGLWISSGKISAALVPIVGAVILQTWSWHYVFYACAIPGVFLAIAWLFMVAEVPARSRYVSAAEVAAIKSPAAVSKSSPTPELSPRSHWVDPLIRAREVRPLESNREIFRSWNLWGNALALMMILGIVNVILAWLPTYLTDVKKYAILNVGFVSAAPFFGAVVGNIVGGWMSDRLFNKRRKPVMMITCASTILSMYALTVAPNGVIALGAMLFMTGVLLNVGFWSFSLFPSGFTTKASFPVAAAATNTLGQVGSAFAPFVTGWMLDHYGWNSVFVFLSMCSLVAAVLIATVVEPINYDRAPAPA